eukprot:2081844-Rhodomonas_salina.3
MSVPLWPIAYAATKPYAKPGTILGSPARGVAGSSIVALPLHHSQHRRREASVLACLGHCPPQPHTRSCRGEPRSGLE